MWCLRLGRVDVVRHRAAFLSIQALRCRGMISAASATRLIRETSAARLSSNGQFYKIVPCRTTFPFRIPSTRAKRGTWRIYGQACATSPFSRLASPPAWSWWDRPRVPLTDAARYPGPGSGAPTTVVKSVKPRYRDEFLRFLSVVSRLTSSRHRHGSRRDEKLRTHGQCGDIRHV